MISELKHLSTSLSPLTVLCCLRWPLEGVQPASGADCGPEHPAPPAAGPGQGRGAPAGVLHLRAEDGARAAPQRGRGEGGDRPKPLSVPRGVLLAGV